MTRFLVLLLLAGSAHAQTVGLEGALRDLAERRGLQLVYSGTLVAGRTTTCPASTRTSSRPAAVVLACVLEGTGLEARRLPSGTFALYRTEASSRPTPTATPASSRTAPAPRPTATLSGTVTDAATGEALIGAAVYAPALGRGATTNAYGFYSLLLPAGPTRVTVSYVGLAPKDTVLEVGAGRFDAALEGAAGGLGEVVVEAVESGPSTAYGSVALTGEDVQGLPALAGEADLLKALQRQPGVGGGVEGTSGLHVRGGTPDQTLVLLDGIPVYNASHLFGFVSVFNADAVTRAELFKGGFPARYGGRLSSVVDVRMREGNEVERQSHARIGLLSSQVLTEGPIGDRGSYLVAGRRTYADLLAAPFLAAAGGIDGVTPVAYFYDLNAKANARVSERDRLFLSLYAGRDRFAGRAEDSDGLGERASGGIGWGNETAALRWTRTLGGRAFAATTVTASDYAFGVDASAQEAGAAESYGVDYRSGIRSVSAQTDLDWTPAAGHDVRLGAALSRHRYEPGVLVYDPSGTASDTTLGSDPTDSWEAAVYLEDDVRLGSALVSAGVRASGYAVDGTAFGAVEPRLGVRLEVGRGIAARASLARMTQYLHLLTTAGGLGLPADLWVPATARVGPERAWHVAAGLEGGTRATRWSADVYAKEMDGLVAYRETAGLLRADADWQDQVTTGGGRAVGLEVALSHAGPRTSAQLAYALSRADRQFDALEDGARFPYRYDRTHDLGLAVRHRLSRRVDVSAAFVYQTGQAVTLPAETYFAGSPNIVLTRDVLPTTGTSSGQVYVYGPRNGFRVPDTHRLDVGLEVFFRRGPRPHALSFDVYNVYNRANPYAVDVDIRTDPETGENRRVLVAQSLLPILPSVSYQFSF